ncbi:glycosyltransferase family 2 protein [Bradyrhizobium sp. 150]|uniref:glycosyltransferase family 2 protein n=1 Tax=Bradyrhizobium sp. 150 TaxID=2782625 RepID=UPI001FF965C9|nr:glycosyltransferase family 2 protein [Bradyrhizobium sp. 150]MCK1675313.1 glycosyltransferase family 2 protein [Bradyrhizobium sp. 150]
MFSVVVPTHNRSDMVKRAIESAAGQVGEAPEIIVVDDGSSLEEAARIADHVAEFPQAKLITMPQAVGAARARNVGVAAASGEVIAFLDSDDWWKPERLSRHRVAFADPSVIFTWNSAHWTPGTIEQARGRFGRPKPQNWTLPIALAAWNFIGGCSLVCVRKRVFEAIGGFDVSLPSCQDWDLYLKLLGRGEFRYIEEILGYVDVGIHQRITTSPRRIIDGHARLHALASQIPKRSNEKRYVKAMHHWTRSEVALRCGDGALTRSELARSFFTRPSGIVFSRVPALLAGSFRARSHNVE